tara:strand:+ start:15713 stop:16480 length:768 start_codon:yes stop_codon:yes gene_type:complete
MQLVSGGDDAISKNPTDELRSNDLTTNPFVAGDAYEVIADSNGLVRLRTRNRLRGVMVVESPFLCSASIAYTKNGITTIRLTRQWEFLERKELSSATVAFDFKTELRGDLDYEYSVDGFWVTGTSAAHSLMFRINGATTGIANEGTAIEGSASLTHAGMAVARCTGAESETHFFTARLLAKSGQFRFAQSHDASTSGTGSTANEAKLLYSKWEDSTTEITTLGLATSSIASQAGSWFDVYRRPQFDKTKLTLWVY